MAILVEPVQFDEIVLREFLHDENEFSWKNDTYESCRGWPKVSPDLISWFLDHFYEGYACEKSR